MWDKMKLMFSAIWVWILPLLKALASSAGKIVLQEAITACKTVAVTMVNASGTDKKDAAKTAIVAALKAQGVTAETALINASIETAVQFLQSKTN